MTLQYYGLRRMLSLVAARLAILEPSKRSNEIIVEKSYKGPTLTYLHRTVCNRGQNVARMPPANDEKYDVLQRTQINLLRMGLNENASATSDRVIARQPASTAKNADLPDRSFLLLLVMTGWIAASRHHGEDQAGKEAVLLCVLLKSIP